MLRRGGGEDPWLCGPGFRRVCFCRGSETGEPITQGGDLLRRLPGRVSPSPRYYRQLGHPAWEQIPISIPKPNGTLPRASLSNVAPGFREGHVQVARPEVKKDSGEQQLARIEPPGNRSCGALMTAYVARSLASRRSWESFAASGWIPCGVAEASEGPVALRPHKGRGYHPRVPLACRSLNRMARGWQTFRPLPPEFKGSRVQDARLGGSEMCRMIEGSWHRSLHSWSTLMWGRWPGCAPIHDRMAEMRPR